MTDQANLNYRRRMNMRRVIAATGIIAVAMYSALLGVQALVLNPLAAVPGLSLDEIYADLRAAGANLTLDTVLVTIIAAIGPLLAIVAAVIGLGKRLPPLTMLALFLVILALGGVATFYSGFAVGMDVADTYMTTGGDHSGWDRVLYVTSLAALVALIPVLIIIRLHSRSARSVAAAGD